ncbi:3' terminal RNA ribose 2'-O-methyltransferase Hen1 [Asanoa iriomotensis]|uniref:Small RNA 2'-O-methyltransferase n=2 Tax=Asanoa iriomotensis TaxID=234613 RepID=A0ABQ4C801_9ACTN|nr:3' terminal RNA ribose 2'-O-methyltransferase Hen1 [Asanoa iriomotensis]
MVTIGTTHRPATDLGYLLVKHPERVHEFELPTGRAVVCFPEADEARCTAALVLEVDPSGRRDTPDGFTLGRFVNDRPYAASSLLSAALNKAFRTAMGGRSKDRPELAATAIPLDVHLPVLRCRGGADLAHRLFAPLGYEVDATAIALDAEHPDWGDSPYVDLRLSGTLRLADALHHLYVLLPVLDDAKHYWVSTDEVDKLVRAGEGWLAAHPERELIVHRYLAHRRTLSEPALERLAEQDDRVVDDSVDGVAPEDTDEDAPALAVVRREAVLRVLRAAGAQRVLDLGCGPGALLADLMADRRFTEIVGVDIAPRALAVAARRLRLDRPGAIAERDRQRVQLLQSALTYRDARLAGYDAAVLMEVIEHVDEARLPALVRSVFGAARPGTVVVTTPNAEYNANYAGLAAGTMRHADHRFEWTRAEFEGWAAGVAAEHGYTVAIEGVGVADPDRGAPTQLAVFTVAGGTDD